MTARVTITLDVGQSYGGLPHAPNAWWDRSIVDCIKRFLQHVTACRGFNNPVVVCFRSFSVCDSMGKALIWGITAEFESHAGLRSCAR